MTWRTIAVVFIAIFVIATVQAGIAGPIFKAAETVNATGDYSNEHFDGNKLITDMPRHWMNMGLVAIFGGMVWGVAVVVRRELTRREL